MARAENKEEKVEKIVVVVRVRPLHKGEATQRSPWKLSSKSIASSKTCRPSVPGHSFTYDKVYGTKSTTLEIYEAHVKDIITSAVSGVNGTIFAYGQSGSGKTSTMRGMLEESGILELAVQDVFKRIQEEKDREYLVRVSYFELENEEFVDLLGSKKQNLDLHDDAQGRIVVAGLREEIVVGSEQILALLEFADARISGIPTNANNCRRAHSIFQMVSEEAISVVHLTLADHRRQVIESSLESQENRLIPRSTDAVQISVLNLVEVAPADSGIVENYGISEEATKSSRSVTTLDAVMSKLAEQAETKGDSLPYSESKLTHLLKPSLGGDTRTCFICHVSPAMIHMDATVETLTFAAKATRVMNCFKADEIWRNRPMLKRQRRDMKEIQNNIKDGQSQDLEDIVNRRNALLMIELESKNMSMEFGRAFLHCGSEKRDHDEDEMAQNQLLEGEFGSDQRNEMDDCRTYLPAKALRGYFEDSHHVEELQDGGHLSKPVCGELSLSPRSGSKRKRRSSTGKVAEKFEQVDLLFQSKLSRNLNSLKAEGTAERQLLTELRNLIEQENKEQHELLARKDDNCKNLQQKIADLEGAQVQMEKRLREQECTFSEGLESLNSQLAIQKARQSNEDLPIANRNNMILAVSGEQQSVTSPNKQNAKGGANLEGCRQETGLQILGSVVKQHTEAQSCLSQDSEEHHNVLNETEGKHTSTKRKSKANKVCQKYQNFQGRSEISNLRKELAVARDTISALEDERDGLMRNLNRMKTDASRSCSDDKVNADMITEDIKGDSNNRHLLAAAVDELKAEVESTLPKTDALLELVLEAFQTLTAALKSFQEGVTELKELRSDTADLSEALEKAKLQLLALRQGKISSEKELLSMKSELAKLECVVERQSGVLKVLSDNEGVLSELSSVKAVMKAAAEASALRLRSMEQEYTSKVEKLESQCDALKKENLQLEEKYSDIRSKLESAQSEVHKLTQALEEKSELENKLTEVQLKSDISEKNLRKLTEALEKSKVEKKKKWSKSRQNTTEAEILRLTQSLGEKEALQEEIKKLQGDLSISRTEVEKLAREAEDNAKARQELLLQLKSSEETVARLLVELEEKTGIESGIGQKIAFMESEVAKVTSLLENTTFHAEAQQREIITSHGRIEILARQLEEMNTLENNYSSTLDRLVQSETEVARLVKTVNSQLEDKSILEQDHTNFMYTLELSQREVARLKTSLNTALQEKGTLEKNLKEVSLELSKSESQTAELTETLARETSEKKVVQEDHLEELVKAQDKCRLLGSTNEDLMGKLTREQQEKEALEEIYQEILEKLTKDQESLRQSEEKHQEVLASSTGTEHKVKLLEKEKEGLVDELVSLETKAMDLAEELAARALGKRELEKKLEEIRDQLSLEQEKTNSLQDKNQNLLEQLAKEQKRECKVNQLIEIGTANLQDNNILDTEASKVLETKPPKNLDKVRREDEESPSEINSAEILAKEREHSGPEEEVRQAAVPNHRGSEDQLAQMTETLARELPEKKTLLRDYEEILKDLHKEQEERRAVEHKFQEILQKISRDEKRELLEKSTQSRPQDLGGLETQVVQLTETLTKELEGKHRLEEHHQKILSELNGEQHEKRGLKVKYEETLKRLAVAIDERDALDKAQQKILDKLAVSEAKSGQVAETLTTELENKRSLQRRHQEIIVELDAKLAEIMSLSEQNKKLQQEQLESVAKVSSAETEIQRLNDKLRDKLQVEEEHKDVSSFNTEVSNMTIALRDKSNLDGEQHRLQLEILNQKGEISKLTKALRVNRKVVKEQKTLIHELTSTQAEVLRLTSALGGRSDKVHVDQNVATDPSVTGIPCGNCGILSQHEQQKRLQERLVSTEAKVVMLEKVLEEKALLENKLAGVQLALSAAEAEIARLTTALDGKAKFDEHFRSFQIKLFEAGLLKKDTTGGQCSIEGFPPELLKMVSELEELKRDLERRVWELTHKERSMRDKEIGSDVDFESLNTIITLREKERDELREQCTAAESKVQSLSIEIENRQQENSAKKWKMRCQKAERDAGDVRGKLEKLEEATSWLVRDKGMLEERISCCEVQLAAARETARLKNKELELSQHKLHVCTSQHQSERAALCEELSVNQAQKAKLEAELHRLLGPHHQPHRPLQETPNFLPNPHFRVSQWPFPQGPM